MVENRLNTKDHLLQIAGELFANLGYDAVSTRMIAERAGVKLSGIHYHFGSKEKLYRAALTFAVEYDNCANFSLVIAENPALLDSPEGLAEIIRTTVFRTFFDHFNKGDNPEWMKHLVIREVLHPSSVFAIVYEMVIKPDAEAAKRIFTSVRPNAGEPEVYAWLDLLHSQLFLYIMAKDALERLRGEGALNQEFYQHVARVVARAMIFELELPLPADLQ